MLRTVVEARTLVAMMVAACVGAWGLRTHPVDQQNLFLALIAAKDPTVFHVLTYGYATLWFSTPFFAASRRVASGVEFQMRKDSRLAISQSVSGRRVPSEPAMFPVSNW